MCSFRVEVEIGSEGLMSHSVLFYRSVSVITGFELGRDGWSQGGVLD